MKHQLLNLSALRYLKISFHLERRSSQVRFVPLQNNLFQERQVSEVDGLTRKVGVTRKEKNVATFSYMFRNIGSNQPVSHTGCSHPRFVHTVITDNLCGPLMTRVQNNAKC